MADTSGPQTASRFCRLCAAVVIAIALVTIVLLVRILNPPVPPPDYSQLPLVSDYDWDAVIGSGWNYAQRTSTYPAGVGMDGTAPVSPGNVLAVNFTGTQQDTEPGVFFHALPSVREAYAEFWIKFSDNWTCAPAGCGKVTFFFPQSGGDLYMGIYCDTPQSQWPGQAAGGCATLDPDHFIVGGQLQFGTYAGWPLLANVTRTPMMRNQWYRIEHYFKWSATPESHDGIWRVYVDGVLNLERTDIAAPIGPAIEFQFAPTRQPPPPPNEFMWIDHTILRGTP